MTILEQRKEAAKIVRSLTGKSLKRSSTGRPIVDAPFDISISHKEDIVVAACIEKPCHIGIDVESLSEKINEKLFLGTIFSHKELTEAKKICRAQSLSESAAAIILWSIKEAFFKCIDKELVPGSVRVRSISRAGKVAFLPSPGLKRELGVMKQKPFSGAIFFESQYVFSLVVSSH